MKLLENVGAVVAVVLLTAGLLWLWKTVPMGGGLSIAILGLVSGPVLALGLYVLHLRVRIAALERRAQEHQ